MSRVERVILVQKFHKSGSDLTVERFHPIIDVFGSEFHPFSKRFFRFQPIVGRFKIQGAISPGEKSDFILLSAILDRNFVPSPKTLETIKTLEALIASPIPAGALNFFSPSPNELDLDGASSTGEKGKVVTTISKGTLCSQRGFCARSLSLHPAAASFPYVDSNPRRLCRICCSMDFTVFSRFFLFLISSRIFSVDVLL